MRTHRPIPSPIAAALLAPGLFACALLVAVLLTARPAEARLDELPDLVQSRATAMVEACRAAGGRPGDPMMAIERIDLTGNGRPDAILDQNRFDCHGRQSMHCAPAGCETFVFVDRRWIGWKQILSVVGSYCIEYGQRPPRFVTIQRNHSFDGGSEILNVRYRFTRGVYFQDGRGRC
ncbi:hypothetical protein [Salinarimonas rosea]|uniref:hypothetical protein n=1 Tax=Salinarimonas rosea TaxID=552063 RepID=UPI0003FD47A8|nr:hypothetical protein [Salinarimonas rosea]